MTLSLLLLIAGVAAGVPVALPPGEVPERWLDPLALHALEVGEASSGARVTLTADGATWTATVVRS